MTSCSLWRLVYVHVFQSMGGQATVYAYGIPFCGALPSSRFKLSRGGMSVKRDGRYLKTPSETLQLYVSETAFMAVQINE